MGLIDANWPDREYRKVERRPRNIDLRFERDFRCSDALRAGDLDACRIVLDQCEMPDDERAALYCRLSEALYYGNRREEALDCARTAFRTATPTTVDRRFLRVAVQQLRAPSRGVGRLSAAAGNRPGWAEGHRHVSGSIAVVGEIDRAIVHAGPGMRDRASHVRVRGACRQSSGNRRPASGGIRLFFPRRPHRAGRPRRPAASGGGRFGDRPSRSRPPCWRCAPMRWPPPIGQMRSMQPNCCCARTATMRRPTIIAKVLAVDREDGAAHRMLSAAQMLVRAAGRGARGDRSGVGGHPDHRRIPFASR